MSGRIWIYKIPDKICFQIGNPTIQSFRSKSWFSNQKHRLSLHQLPFMRLAKERLTLKRYSWSIRIYKEKNILWSQLSWPPCNGNADDDTNLRLADTNLRPLSLTISVVNLNAINNYTNALTVLQKRALRFMTLSKPWTLAVPLFISSKILQVNMVYFETVHFNEWYSIILLLKYF